MPNARLARLLRLLTLIRGRVARSAADLAVEMEVSERTIYRDLAVLELAGVPCRFDPEMGGYRTGGDFFLPPMQLTFSEALALSVLGGQLGNGTQVPFLGDAWRAVTKIRGQLPAAVRDEVADLDGSVRVQGTRAAPQAGCDRHFEVIRRAIAARRKVRCTYPDGRNGGSATRVDDTREPFLFLPYALYFGQRAWYAIGYSERSGGERSLKLNRLKSVVQTDRPYMIPDGWSLERSFGHAWRMIRGKRRYLVEVRFDGEHGRNVADTLWHPTQSIAWDADGSCRFRCEVDGLDEIVWWVLGYGPHAEVVGPAELREMVATHANAMAALYQMNTTAREKPDAQKVAMTSP